MKKSAHTWQFRIFLLTVFLLISLGAWLHLSHFFTVKNISCSVVEGACPDYIQAEFNSYKGKSIFFTDFWKAGQQISQFAPSFQLSAVNKRMPNTVEIVFTSAKPVYQLLMKNNQLWIVDEVGTIIADQADPQLPTISSQLGDDFSLQINERLPTELHQGILSLLDGLAKHRIEYAKLSLTSGNEISIELTDGKKVLILISDVPLAMEKLNFLLNDFNFATIKEPIKVVDLRFQHPVLRSTEN
jgi:hypothetical protein